MNLIEVIAVIERDLPAFRWLVRACDSDEYFTKGAYLASICEEGNSWLKAQRGEPEPERFYGEASTPEEALADAYNQAMKFIGPNPSILIGRDGNG